MTASPYVIAVVNQKGGVGKTTSAVNLGACLAASERPTLLIDMDPQANASSAYGIVNAERRGTAVSVRKSLVRCKRQVLLRPSSKVLTALCTWYGASSSPSCRSTVC